MTVKQINNLCFAFYLIVFFFCWKENLRFFQKLANYWHWVDLCGCYDTSHRPSARNLLLVQGTSNRFAAVERFTLRKITAQAGEWNQKPLQVMSHSLPSLLNLLSRLVQPLVRYLTCQNEHPLVNFQSGFQAPGGDSQVLQDLYRTSWILQAWEKNYKTKK